MRNEMELIIYIVINSYIMSKTTLYRYGLEVFNYEKLKFKRWLLKTNISLGNKKPRGTGQGGVYCPTNEFLILARRGKMPKVTRIDSTWWLTKRPHNSHSTKPEFFQDMIETVSEEPRLEMFARRERKGWSVFGNEVENSIDLSEYYT